MNKHGSSLVIQPQCAILIWTNKELCSARPKKVLTRSSGYGTMRQPGALQWWPCQLFHSNALASLTTVGIWQVSARTRITRSWFVFGTSPEFIEEKSQISMQDKLQNSTFWVSSSVLLIQVDWPHVAKRTSDSGGSEILVIFVDQLLCYNTMLEIQFLHAWISNMASDLRIRSKMKAWKEFLWAVRQVLCTRSITRMSS